jgi:hypothetical protein
MKKIILAVCIFLTGTGLLYSQNINGRISSSLYAYERFDTADASANYLRTFQLLNLNINKDKFALRTSLNFETDLSADLNDDPRLRFYNLYLEGRDLFGIATIKLGRQPVFNNIGGGLFDGVDLLLKKGMFKLSAYYGGNVPAYQKLEIIENWEDNYIFGGKFSAVPLPALQLSLGYVNKNYRPEDYWADIVSAEMDPIRVLIQSNSNQFKFGFAEADYDMKNVFSINTRYEYDFNFEETSQVEVFGTFKKIHDLKINVYYNYREPRVRYNSIFSVFDYGNTQEIEAGADYTLNKYITLSGKFGFIEYKDENSKRISLGAASPYGTLLYRKNLGYSGEMDALSLYSAYTFLEGMLTPSLGVSYTTYKLSKDAEKNNLTSLLAGVNVRPWRALSFDLQGQFMNNKIYKNDYRLFFKINYWFNTNLDWM